LSAVSIAAPGRNDPCPCGSGRKFKHCCLPPRTAEDSARLRLRAAEGRVVEELLRFVAETWGEPLVGHAWEDFWNYDDVPEDLTATPEFDPMFIPWLVLGFVPDVESDDADVDWPSRPIGLEWLATTDKVVPGLDRAYIETACRSPMSVFAVEQVTSGRSLDLKDVLTGSRFRVLEQGASQTLRAADLIFARVLTIEDVSLMLGTAPFVVPPRWHTHIIDWRARLMRKRLMTRQDLADFDIEIRDLYFDIAAELLDPTPPRLCNTDGDPIALTTLTYELKTTLGEAFEKLAPLAMVHGEDHSDEVVRDASGAVTSASLSWVKAGNRHHKQWDNTVLGTIRLETGRVVADVNSARRAARFEREIARRLGQAATLIDTTVVDPFEAIADRARSRVRGERHDESTPQLSPELNALQEELTRKQWEEWLDTRLPALRNKTPRQAARTAIGRERLEALLAGFDRDAAHGPSSGAAHLIAIRAALGLSEPLRLMPFGNSPR
jgi:SEC-C motif-containing protein